MITQLDYRQFLLSSPFNYTQTYFAEHVEGLSHDRVNRLLRQMDVQPEDLWKSVKETIVLDPDGYLAYDDTVLDKLRLHPGQPCIDIIHPANCR